MNKTNKGTKHEDIFRKMEGREKQQKRKRFINYEKKIRK